GVISSSKAPSAWAARADGPPEPPDLPPPLALTGMSLDEVWRRLADTDRRLRHAEAAYARATMEAAARPVAGAHPADSGWHAGLRARRVKALEAYEEAATEAAAAPGRRSAALRDPVFLRLLVLQSALVIFGLGQFESVVPAVLRDAHLSVVAISVVIACNTAGIIAFQGLALRAVERVGYTGALWVAIVTWMAALAFLAGALLFPAPRGRLLLGVLFGLVFAVGQCLIAPSVQPLVTRTAPPGAVEGYAAATSLAHGLGMFVAPLVLLPVVESGGTGSYLSVQLLGYCLALYVLWSFRTRRATPREDTVQPAGKAWASR
ncbi:MFS transporter, partial [Streptomyces asiaticus]